MKRDNIFISENRTAKRVSVVKFVAPGDVPGFDCSIHFGEEGNDVTMQNCIIKNNLIVKCSPEDTYDFETGALIALMKMCGKDKVIKACDELYKDDKYKNALQEMTENNEKLIEENNYLNYVISCRESAIESLENTRDLLIDKNNELIEENRKLKLDCEKLQHGYNDVIFCGGRQNGKQYTALVNMFKKIDQKKVDAAYKEAYNTTLPVWQKEVLKQACNIVMDKKEKRNGEQINKLTVDSLIERSRAFTRKCVDEWLYGPPTKREEMWEKILEASKCPPVEIKVAKQDIKTFLKELQDKIPEAMWNGSDDCLPSEYTNPYWFKHDYIYFALFRNDDKGKLRICYDDHKHNWIDKPVIEYIAPMRWDLFKKGRLVVKVDSDNYEDFYNKCETEIGRKPSTRYSGTFTVYYKYEKELEEYIFHTRPYKNTIPYAKRVVNWEDVR